MTTEALRAELEMRLLRALDALDGAGVRDAYRVAVVDLDEPPHITQAYRALDRLARRGLVRRPTRAPVRRPATGSACPKFYYLTVAGAALVREGRAFEPSRPDETGIQNDARP